jgi:hypothetical protein
LSVIKVSQHFNQLSLVIGVAKVETIFTTTKYFLKYFNVFFNFLFCTDHSLGTNPHTSLISYSKNGTAKIHNS